MFSDVFLHLTATPMDRLGFPSSWQPSLGNHLPGVKQALGLVNNLLRGIASVTSVTSL
jgi:hypothetical protein